MNKITFGNVTGTILWAASAVKMLGYVWAAYTSSYDASAFQVGGGGSTGTHDIPIVPPLKRKQKPGGGKTKLPRPYPLPKLPPVPITPGQPTGSVPVTPSPSPWNIFNPDWTPGDLLQGLGDIFSFG